MCFRPDLATHMDCESNTQLLALNFVGVSNLVLRNVLTCYRGKELNCAVLLCVSFTGCISIRVHLKFGSFNGIHHTLPIIFQQLRKENLTSLHKLKQIMVGTAVFSIKACRQKRNKT